jgi:hypothetical protein
MQSSISPPHRLLLARLAANVPEPVVGADVLRPLAEGWDVAGCLQGPGASEGMRNELPTTEPRKCRHAKFVESSVKLFDGTFQTECRIRYD